MRLGISKATAGKLIDADFTKVKRLRAATDQELLAIEGVGQATVDKVRLGR